MVSILFEKDVNSALEGFYRDLITLAVEEYNKSLVAVNIKISIKKVLSYKQYIMLSEYKNLKVNNDNETLKDKLKVLSEINGNIIFIAGAKKDPDEEPVIYHEESKLCNIKYLRRFSGGDKVELDTFSEILNVLHGFFSRTISTKLPKPFGFTRLEDITALMADVAERKVSASIKTCNVEFPPIKQMLKRLSVDYEDGTGEG